MHKRPLIGTILLAIAVILMGLSLFLPWYYQQFKMSGSIVSLSYTVDFYLDHAQVSGGIVDGSGYIGPNDWNMSEELYYDDENASEIKYIQTFQTTQILAFVGLVGCLIGLIGATLIVIKKIGYALGALLITIAVILALIAPLYILFALTAAYKEEMDSYASSDSVENKMGENFFGSQEYEYGGTKVRFSWGGSLGWFMALIAMILCVAALFLIIFSRVKPSPISRTYARSQINYEKRSFPTAHKEEGWSEYESYESPYAQENHITPSSQLIFSPIGPKPAAGSPPKRFQCPECKGIVVVSIPRRPLNVTCSKCGANGIIE